MYGTDSSLSKIAMLNDRQRKQQEAYRHGCSEAEGTARLPVKGTPDDPVLCFYPISKAISLLLVGSLGLPLRVYHLGHPLYLLLAVLDHACTYPLHYDSHC